MTIDFDKPVQMKNGTPVRIVSRNCASNTFTVVGFVLGKDGRERLHTWTAEGHYHTNRRDDKDLENAPDLRDMVPTLADALEVERAKVAAAYEAGQLRMRELCADMVEREGHGLHVAIRYAPLIPAEAQAALDKLLAEARLAGWRAGQVDMQSQAYDACREWMRNDDSRRIEDVILALPEPKETSHG